LEEINGAERYGLVTMAMLECRLAQDKGRLNMEGSGKTIRLMRKGDLKPEESYYFKVKQEMTRQKRPNKIRQTHTFPAV